MPSPSIDAALPPQARLLPLNDATDLPDPGADFTSDAAGQSSAFAANGDAAFVAAPEAGLPTAEAFVQPSPSATTTDLSPSVHGAVLASADADHAAAATFTPSAASASAAASGPALNTVGLATDGTTGGGSVTSGTATRGTEAAAGHISVIAGSVVAKPGQTVAVSSLFSVAASASNPTYLILSGLDRDEYTAGYNVNAMGSVSGNGVTQKFSSIGSDAYTVGVVFTYQAATGRYYNASYGYFDQMTVKTSTNTNDNVNLSVVTTSNASLAAGYANNPYVLSANPTYFGYVGSVSIVVQPSFTGPTPTQATPDSICSVAASFVGKAWNQDGCWVLASNISAEAGASLPLTSTSIGIPGAASGEWVVAYNGPVSASSNWESQVTAGEVVAFETTSGGGHITTVVSGSGTSAELIDNITYVYANGSIANSAHDGSASDIIIAAPHAATQEFNGVNPNMVVVYELDTPVVSDAVASLSLSERNSQALAPLFNVVNPLAGQTVTAYQVFDTDTADAITVNGVAQTADHSIGSAVTVTSLANVALLAGSALGSDTIDVRAFNGSYWGDWQSLTATIAAPAPPTVTSQTAAQTWQQGQKVSFTLPANTFTDPQGETLGFTATQSNGQALPSWLSFNASSKTFSGTVPTGAENLTLKITATDTSGLTASETFGINVPAAAPTVSNQTAAQTWTDKQQISFTLPANTFVDPQGQALTLTAFQDLTPGSPQVTSWLAFNAATRTFTGTVPGNSVGTLTLEVVAKDVSGLSASELFNVTLKAPSGGVTGAVIPLVPPKSSGFTQLASSLH